MFGLVTSFPVEFRRLVFVLRLEAKKSHKICAASRAQWDVLAKDKMTINRTTGKKGVSPAAVGRLFGGGVFLNHSLWGLAGLYPTSN